MSGVKKQPDGTVTAIIGNNMRESVIPASTPGFLRPGASLLHILEESGLKLVATEAIGGLIHQTIYIIDEKTGQPEVGDAFVTDGREVDFVAGLIALSKRPPVPSPGGSELKRRLELCCARLETKKGLK